jgi:integrase
LLASSGLRVGEALQLNVDDVRLNATTPHLHIVEGKFRKSRLVPLHATVEKLAAYDKERKRLCSDALSDAFFASEKGGYITYDACLGHLRRAPPPHRNSKGRRPPPTWGSRASAQLRRWLDGRVVQGRVTGQGADPHAFGLPGARSTCAHLLVSHGNSGTTGCRGRSVSAICRSRRAS